MAKTPAPNTPDDDPAKDPLFREVQDELRQERMHALWKQFGPWVIAGAVAIVLVVAGYQGWQGWQASVRAEEAQAFAAAESLATAGDLAGAAEAYARLADTGSTGYASLAALRLGGVQAQRGDLTAAAETLNAMAAAGTDDPALADAATLLSIMARMNDGGDPQILEAELSPLAAETSPFRFTARELQAHLAHAQGDDDRAARLLGELSQTQAAPQPLTQRAAETLAAWGLNAPEPTPEANGQEPATDGVAQ